MRREDMAEWLKHWRRTTYTPERADAALLDMVMEVINEERAWTDEDKTLPEDAAIKVAHPTRSGRHDTYREACRLVGAKRSKYALVDLVNWLLVEREKAEARGREACLAAADGTVFHRRGGPGVGGGELQMSDLDPGVRSFVKWLRDHGFETTDSGDGVSKPAEAMVLEFPHVVIRVHDMWKLGGEANRLAFLLGKNGTVVQNGEIQASYDPADGSSAIMVLDEQDRFIRSWEPF